MGSMIDVVFLLLIYFIVTTTQSSEEASLSSTIRADAKGGTPSDLTPQVIVVSRAGDAVTYTIGERQTSNQIELAKILAGLPKEAGAVVRAGDDVPVGHVASVMQAVSDAGFEKRSYVPARATGGTP